MPLKIENSIYIFIKLYCLIIIQQIVQLFVSSFIYSILVILILFILVNKFTTISHAVQIIVTAPPAGRHESSTLTAVTYWWKTKHLKFYF